jgi:hypothetical protein
MHSTERQTRQTYGVAERGLGTKPGTFPDYSRGFKDVKSQPHGCNAKNRPVRLPGAKQ